MSAKLKIEKGVPLNGDARCRYPWREMEVGDSFFVAAKNPQAAQAVQVSICGSAARQDGKYTTRRVDGGVRCWRVE
jgi:hypothetical protein